MKEREILKQLLHLITNIVTDQAGTFFKSFEWNGSQQARYIHITATINPALRGWVFTDEIVVW